MHLLATKAGAVGRDSHFWLTPVAKRIPISVLIFLPSSITVVSCYIEEKECHFFYIILNLFLK